MPSDPKRVRGHVFEIQRFSIHDGPGIRTTVFLKGCPLRCPWCHNPEGLTRDRQLSFMPGRCIGCGRCVDACRHGALHMSPRGITLDRAVCKVCGDCAVECWSRAIEVVGRRTTAADVIGEVLKDACFYETSGGGLTLSGGEPLAQPAFTAAILRAARAHGLHTCIETCGEASPAVLKNILGMTDLFLFDIKETDPLRHERWTGVSNRRILKNLIRLHAAGANICLRLPLIPGYNDREDHLEAVAKLVKSLPGLVGVNIMPFHRFGRDKEKRLGMPGRMELPRSAPGRAEAWRRRLQELGIQRVG